MAGSRRAALVTGSNKNIGRACVMQLAQAGCNVVVNGARDKDAAEAVAAEARKLGVEAIVAMGDVGDRTDLDGMVAAAKKAFGGIDILVNNAAIRLDGKFLEMAEEDWRYAMAVNFDAAYVLARAFLPGMLAKGWGRIINFAGMNAIHGYNGRAHVSASKHAAWGLTKALAKEFSGRGVCVNAIAPGFIETDMTGELTPDMREGILKTVPLGFFGAVEDIANATLFLAGKGARYITGQVLTVDGGMVM